MERQPDGLDPYDLLEISPELRPPTHYQLLGIDDFETDLAVIEQAAKKRGAYLHQIAAGPQRKAVQQLLGEVAIARRTLLNSETKQQYDQQLSALLEDDVAAASASPFQIAIDNGAATEGDATATEPTAARTRRRRKSKWDEYKLHLLSASILLVIVGIVWFVHRNSGQRVASKAPSAPAQPASSVNTSVHKRASSSASLPAARSSRPPQAPPQRSTPSLSPTFDLSAFQAPQMSKPGGETGQQKSKLPAQSAAEIKAAANGASQTPSTSVTPVALELKSDWQPEIKLVDEFKTKLEARYAIDKQRHALTLQNERAVITSPSPKRVFGSLRHKSLKLTAKDAVALDTNLAPGDPTPAQVGFALGTLRIVLSTTPKAVQVRAKNQQAAGPMKTLGQLEAVGGETTLMLWRDAGDPNQVLWMAKSNQHTLSGRIKIDKLGQPPINVVYLSPDQKFKQPVWFDNLRVGPFVNAPELPASEPLKL